jgi:hypothetical protein
MIKWIKQKLEPLLPDRVRTKCWSDPVDVARDEEIGRILEDFPYPLTHDQAGSVCDRLSTFIANAIKSDLHESEPESCMIEPGEEDLVWTLTWADAASLSGERLYETLAYEAGVMYGSLDDRDLPILTALVKFLAYRMDQYSAAFAGIQVRAAVNSFECRLDRTGSVTR